MNVYWKWISVKGFWPVLNVAERCRKWVHCRNTWLQESVLRHAASWHVSTLFLCASSWAQLLPVKLPALQYFNVPFWVRSGNLAGTNDTVMTIDKIDWNRNGSACFVQDSIWACPMNPATSAFLISWSARITAACSLYPMENYSLSAGCGVTLSDEPYF